MNRWRAYIFFMKIKNKIVITLKKLMDRVEHMETYFIEAGNKRQWYPSLLIHLSPQVNVTVQVFSTVKRGKVAMNLTSCRLQNLHLLS
jgi:hypothetical protein